MIYYALFHGQDEGCDYTIGCNMVYEKLKSTTIKEAKKELKERIEDYGGISREGGWEEIVLLEVSKEINKVIPDKEWDE
jgi:hypothetical protein